MAQDWWGSASTSQNQANPTTPQRSQINFSSNNAGSTTPSGLPPNATTIGSSSGFQSSFYDPESSSRVQALGEAMRKPGNGLAKNGKSLKESLRTLSQPAQSPSSQFSPSQQAANKTPGQSSTPDKGLNNSTGAGGNSGSAAGDGSFGNDSGGGEEVRRSVYGRGDGSRLGTRTSNNPTRTSSPSLYQSTSASTYGRRTRPNHLGTSTSFLNRSSLNNSASGSGSGPGFGGGGGGGSGSYGSGGMGAGQGMDMDDDVGMPVKSYYDERRRGLVGSTGGLAAPLAPAATADSDTSTSSYIYAPTLDLPNLTAKTRLLVFGPPHHLLPQMEHFLSTHGRLASFELGPTESNYVIATFEDGSVARRLVRAAMGEGIMSWSGCVIGVKILGEGEEENIGNGGNAAAAGTGDGMDVDRAAPPTQNQVAPPSQPAERDQQPRNGNPTRAPDPLASISTPLRTTISSSGSAFRPQTAVPASVGKTIVRPESAPAEFSFADGQKTGASGTPNGGGGFGSRVSGYLVSVMRSNC